jgi:hypothetical protein
MGWLFLTQTGEVRRSFFFVSDRSDGKRQEEALRNRRAERSGEDYIWSASTRKINVQNTYEALHVIPTSLRAYASCDIRSDTALYPNEYENFTVIPDEQTKIIKIEYIIHEIRSAGFKTRRSISYTIMTLNSCFWLCCCLFGASALAHFAPNGLQ